MTRITNIQLTNTGSISISNLTITPKTIRKVKLQEGWQSHLPNINCFSKTFEVQVENQSPYLVGLKIWVEGNEKEALWSSNFQIPKDSMLYQYITSMDKEKGLVLKQAEKVLISSYTTAKEFIKGFRQEDNIEVQKDIEIRTVETGIMIPEGVFGIGVDYRYVEHLLNAIQNGNKEIINNFKNLFLNCFAHEMTHFLKSETKGESNTENEIISYTIGFLACACNDPLSEKLFIEPALSNPNTPVKKAIQIALKVIQHKLLKDNDCKIKPIGHRFQDLLLSINSMEEPIRYKVIKEIANKIFNSTHSSLKDELLCEEIPSNIVHLSNFLEQRAS